MVAVQEALKQVQEGMDFSSPKEAFKGLSSEDAVKIPEASPYSIATQVYHMWFWQDRWLRQIAGEKSKPWKDDGSDFPVITADEWPAIRDLFLTDFAKMQENSQQKEIFEKTNQFGHTYETLMLRCALHSAYHLGQIVLIRRMMGWKPS